MSEKGTFEDVLRGEIKVINERRKRIAEDKRTNKPAMPPEEWHVEMMKLDKETALWCKADEVGGKYVLDERGREIRSAGSKQEIVGLALSGGGIRSAAFCLGVLQGLDAVIPNNNEPQILHAVDYLSTVSGGSYMGAALTAGLMQRSGQFPFESKLDQMETIETMHLREFSNYLLPHGIIDIFTGVAAIIRGLSINATLFLGVILFAASVTVLRYPTELALHHSYAIVIGGAQEYFFWTVILFLIFLFLQAVLWKFWQPKKLDRREYLGEFFGWFIIAWPAVFFLELQPYVLAGVFDAAHLNYQDSNYRENWVGFTLHGLNTPISWASIVSAATALATFGNKLAAVADATRSDRTWPGFFKHWASRLSLYTSALIVPLILWATYLAFCYWAISYQAEGPFCVAPQAPNWLARIATYSDDVLAWLKAATRAGHTWMGPIPNFSFLYLLAAILIFLCSFFVTPNETSHHNYYRDRLSRAFLWNLQKLERGALDLCKTTCRLGHLL
jgi:Patatin-like phospholipase